MTLPRLYVLGDSISIEYGPHLQVMLAGVFDYSRKSGDEEARLNLDNPQGANGGDSSMCLAYLRGRFAAGDLKADVLLLNCGLHDVKHTPDNPTGPCQVHIDDYQRNLTTMVALASENRTPLVWVRTTPVDETAHNKPGSGIIRYQGDVDRYNAVADAVMAEHGVPTIDLAGFTLSLGAAHQMLRDGRHFHEPIQKLQAAFIAGWLRCYWASRRAN
jgi:lysophospholipase L1-like esterase